MKKTWKELTATQKISYVIMFIICGVAFLYFILKGVGIIKSPYNFTYPALCLVSICEIFQDWNGNRKFAYLAIATAVFFAVLTVLEFI